MLVRTHTFDLPLKHEFRISREAYSVQPTFVVELQDGEHRGFGEATTNNYYGITLEALAASVDRVRPIVERFEFGEPAELWEAVAAELLADNPFAVCAIDQAAHDLWGKRQGRAVYELWGLSAEAIPPSNYTIGIDSVETMVAKLEEYPGWPVYKIKLGTADDLQIVRELREHTDALFRVDANCGWTAEETIRNSSALKSLNVEFIEQPLPATAGAEMRRVFAQSSLPLIADESCITEADVAACEGLFHGINIKLVKCGGLTPARRMIDTARRLGLKVMVGCMTESTVGISAIAQLLPLLDYVDMDGAALLASDIATGVRVERGICHYPNLPGSGVTLL